MRSCACLFAVLILAVSVPVFSEGMVNPFNQQNQNLFSCQRPVPNPAIASFSFLADTEIFEITASATEGGEVKPSYVTALQGASYTFYAGAEHGYAINKWYLDDMLVQEGDTSYTISDVQSDHSLEVTFLKVECTLRATAGPNGTITPSFSYISPGGDEQFTAIPNLGYAVDEWYLDDDLARVGGDVFKLTNIRRDHNIRVTFRQSLAYSLNEIEFDDEDEYDDRVINNNTDSEEPDKALVLVDRTEGPEADNVVMRMRNEKDPDPNSPDYGQLVHARAKGAFVETDADEILVRFRYLFLTSKPGVEIVVYLSDSPELLASDDPLFTEHYLECARIAPPPYPRPGSENSNRFAVFQKVVWTGHLDFTEGVYIELELIEPDTSGLLFAGPERRVASNSSGSSVFIDDWNPAVQCYGICMDINWDNFVDEADFLMVIGGTGCSASGENSCLDGAFSGDGYVDSYDVGSWDWAMNSDERLLNFCGVPLTGGDGGFGMMSLFRNSAAPMLNVSLADSDLSDLMIAGKMNDYNASSKLKDKLYIFDSEGECRGQFDSALDRCNVRLIKGPDGTNYQLNSELGLLRLDSDNTVIVPPGKVTLSNMTEPRYNKSAVVDIGIQGEGSDAYGRPILDAAIDTEHVYVVPVVVNPDGEEPYTAAAKLKLLEGASPPYEVAGLYDEPPLENDNQYRNHLRELEIDNDGNLYVLNVHALNESDILWKYKPDGTFERIDLGRPDGDSHIPAPVSMFMSNSTDILYLASALYNPTDPDSTTLYGLSTKNSMALERTITIVGMQHITGITEEPQNGTLWVSGFNMYDIPLYPNPFQMAFYYPMLARIPQGSDLAELKHLYDIDSHDLALPMSILWTGSSGHN